MYWLKVHRSLVAAEVFALWRRAVVGSVGVVLVMRRSRQEIVWMVQDAARVALCELEPV